MKNTGALVATLAIAVGLWGCSQEGKLNVRNECSTEFSGHIDNQAVTIDPGMAYHTNIYIGKTLAVIGPKEITVPIDGSAWTKKHFAEEVLIKHGGTTIYRITDDTGACDFTNFYSLSINSLRVKSCDSTQFHPNVLEKNQKLVPGDKHLMQLDKGCWDILVNYGRQEFLDTITAVQIKIGEVDTITWQPGH